MDKTGEFFSLDSEFLELYSSNLKMEIFNME